MFNYSFVYNDAPSRITASSYYHLFQKSFIITYSVCSHCHRIKWNGKQSCLVNVEEHILCRMHQKYFCKLVFLLWDFLLFVRSFMLYFFQKNNIYLNSLELKVFLETCLLLWDILLFVSSFMVVHFFGKQAFVLLF